MNKNKCCCRYCAYANLCDEELVYCDYNEKVIKGNTARTYRKCNGFEFNEIDVFDIDKTYKPRNKYKKNKINNNEVQLKLNI